MAISGSVVFEVRTTGSDTNGGGYVSGGTDWSQQASPQYSVTDGVTAGTTTITSASAAFGTDVVGNLVSVSGGTGSVVQSWYQIITRNSATSITVDRSTGLTAGTGVTLKIGGCFASPGVLSDANLMGASTAGMKAWVKSGTYTLTTATAGPSGPMVFGGFDIGNVIEGYQTTRGDRAARPVVTAGSVTGLTSGAFGGAGSRSSKVVNMEVNANNGTGNACFAYGALYYLCLARNTVSGNAGFTSALAVRCAAVSCSIGFGANSFFDCMADTCGTGFSGGSNPVRCIAKNCTTRGFDTSNSKVTNCVAYNNVDGFDWTVSQGGGSVVVSSVAYGNSGIGFRSSGTTGGVTTINCAAGSNTGGNFNGTLDESPITLTANPFTNAAGGDFSINNTAGGGALLRAAGERFGDGLSYDQINYVDVGVFQHQDAGGSSGPLAQLKTFGRGSPY